MELAPGFTRIIHPGLGIDSVSVVPESSLPHWHRCGWRLLAPGEMPAAEPDEAPEPVTLADVAGTAETAETTED